MAIGWGEAGVGRHVSDSSDSKEGWHRHEYLLRGVGGSGGRGREFEGSAFGSGLGIHIRADPEEVVSDDLDE